MSEKSIKSLKILKTLTLLEASELVTKIEETFGRRLSCGRWWNGNGSYCPAEEVEEKLLLI
jgi:ribosomal protein L7/L12